MFDKLFILPGKTFAEVNLEALAQRHRRLHPDQWTGVSPLFKRPRELSALIAAEARDMNADYTYGGYGEDRSTLWKGTYLTGFMHLGIDVTVPEETIARATCSGSIVGVDSDPDQDGGWGSRVFLRTDSSLLPSAILIFAHLAQNPFVRVGQRVYPGEPLGAIGETVVNGGWFPHFHGQVVASGDWPCVRDNLHLLDGYCRADQFAKLSTVFPDPTPYFLGTTHKTKLSLVK